VIVGIDASNIRVGGGALHLIETLRAADPQLDGFSKVIVWSRQSTLDRLADRPWLIKAGDPLLEKSLPFRAFWQRFRLAPLARDAGCDVLFVPGGTYPGDFFPIVNMSQNLLPFEWRELSRYGWTVMTFKQVMLRFTQTRTMRRAQGMIFLTNYARQAVMRSVKTAPGRTAIIPYGLDHRFMCPPRPQLPAGSYSEANPIKLIYVSIVDVYKHQWHVAEAVAELRREGLPVELHLVGPSNPRSLARLRATLEAHDPDGKYLQYLGVLPHHTLHQRYADEDLCVFASSCENLPNILLEGMASGLPVACSQLGPMPEVLGEAGVYFDPERPADIARALRELIADPDRRARLAADAMERARAYSWTRCARETFGFLARVAAEAKSGPARA
jgi:glycosyltransferase involved in cell wall biosynthesis